MRRCADEPGSRGRAATGATEPGDVVPARALPLLLGVLSLAQGLVIAAVWVVPPREDAPFDPARSWLLGEHGTVTSALGVVVGLTFVATGLAVLAGVAWWPGAAVIGGSGGVALLVLWFHPWLILSLAISVTVLAAGLGALVVPKTGAAFVPLSRAWPLRARRPPSSR